MIKTQIYIPDDLFEKAKINAKTKGIKNFSQYVRDLLIADMKKKPKTKKPNIKIVKLKNRGVTNIATNHNDIYEK